MGFALSGGGIRSATFCLGVFQALARRRLLHAVDYLSTVSGGGYFGSFWTAWLSRGSGRAHFETVERQLADSESPPVHWLRENGRYLAPSGNMDSFLAFAVHLRNLAAVHAVIGVYMVFWFAVINAASGAIEGGTWNIVVTESYFSGTGWRLPLERLGWMRALLGASFLPLACVGFTYWLIPDTAKGPLYRNRSSSLFSRLLLLSAVLGLAALVDGAARWIYLQPSLKVGLGLLGASLVTTAARRIYAWAEALLSARRYTLPTAVLVYAGGLSLAAVWLLALDSMSLVLAHEAAFRFGRTFQEAMIGLAVTAGVCAVLLNWVGGRRFINLSSHATLYAARLTRTFLGASNEERHRPGAEPVTDALASDTVSARDFRPWEAGGPVHLVNVTINETVLAGDTEQRDRHGLPLAVGPAGLSVGVRHHAAFPDPNTRDRVNACATSRPFKVWGEGGRESRPQARSLGEWIAISGAAVTTGLGSRSHRVLSFLLGFTNIRLGYWWDSGAQAENPLPPSARRRWPGRLLARVHRTVFPVQSDLLNEWLGRFHGPHRPVWYLSDGGHFENTGAYELVRRELPFIVICDAGGDPAGAFEDLANLVRKARLDFGAEITVCDGPALLRRVPDPEMRVRFGASTDLTPDDAGRSRAHALLADITYASGTQGLLVLLKPTLTGDEPLDVLHYDHVQADFPHESTADQFFDEAQWESYRRLGEHIGDTVFAQARADLPKWGLLERSIPRR